MTEFRLLGQVDCVASGRVLDAGPPRRQAVLAALAVDAGRPVHIEVLVERVWDEPPAAARSTLYGHVSHLRHLLSGLDAAAAPLAGRHGAYLLDVEPDRVDLHRFRGLVEQSRAPKLPDTERAALLALALGLWRGVALAGVPTRWAAEVRENAEQQRVAATVAWARLALQLARPDEVIEAARDLLPDHPLVEPLVAVLIRGLASVGRHAEALECYAAARARLVDELGTEPGAELRELHEALLKEDVASLHPRQPPLPVPAQLPRDVSGFVGRRRELGQLDAVLATATAEPTTVPVCALSGTAGVGKTALAVHWAHQVADRFPDGQLYVNLRGFDPAASALAPADVVRTVLEVLGLPPEQLPSDVDAQAGLYRSMLAGRRMLILLDNARDAEQVRPLLPGAPGALVLATSRDQLAGLVAAHGAHPVLLDVLSISEGHELLSRRLGAARVQPEPAAVRSILDRCAGLPLALAIVAARSAIHPVLPLATLAADLRAHCLDILTADAVTDVRAVFSWSYRGLDPEAARLFRLLGLHPGPDISPAAAGSLAGLPLRQVRPLLDQLTRQHLLVEHRPGRFAFHDLLRVYAADLADRTESGEDRRAATGRMLDHYLQAGHRAARLLNPHRDPITTAPPRDAVVTEDLRSRDRAWCWFDSEQPVMASILDELEGPEYDRHIWQLAWALADFLDRRGRWQQWLRTWQAGLDAAQRLADEPAQALTHRGLARACTQLGRSADAAAHYRHALALYRRLDDQIGQAHTHGNLARLLERQGDCAQALDHAGQALELFTSAGHRSGRANSLNAVGWYQAQLGDYREALTSCGRALALLRELDDRDGQADVWDSMGFAYRQLDDLHRATACYRRSVELWRGTGTSYEVACTLDHLGDTYRAAGETGAAREAWREAGEILTELSHPDADRLRAKLDA